MLRPFLSVVLAASAAHPFVVYYSVGPISNWLAPHPTLLSLHQLVLARIVCLILSLFTVSGLIYLALRMIKIPHTFLIVLCSTTALLGLTIGTFFELAHYSRAGVFLLNAAIYLSVYALFYCLFVRMSLSMPRKLGGGLTIALILSISFPRLSYSLDRTFWMREQISIVKSFDFTMYAAAKISGNVKLNSFVAQKYAGSPPHLQLNFSQGIQLYQAKLTPDFNPPTNCGPIIPGLSFSTPNPCEKVFKSAKGREVYVHGYSNSISKDYYVRINDTLITFILYSIELTSLNLEDFVDSLEPTNAEGLQTLVRPSQ